jgi:AraC family transcriptional regulator
MKAAATNEALLSESVGHGPDVSIGAPERGWHLARWRDFLTTHRMPPLPYPMFIVHVGGSRHLRAGENGGWSNATSMPGLTTIIPAGKALRWFIGGELDVVTLSISPEEIKKADARKRFSELRFGFFDSLGLALTREILACLYSVGCKQRQNYLTTLIDAFKAHVIYGPITAESGQFPVSRVAAFGVHRAMSLVLSNPELAHTLQSLAREAGLAPAYFSRVFKHAIGTGPHRYVHNVRMERAMELLANRELSVAQVAAALGYVSQSHFGRLFREHTGFAPQEWRQRKIQMAGMTIAG